MDKVKTCPKCKCLRPLNVTCSSYSKIGKVCMDCNDWKVNDKSNICYLN